MNNSKGKADTEAFWKKLVADYDPSSGLTKKVYCEQHGVSYSRYKHWQNRFTPCHKNESDTPPFIPVVVKRAARTETESFTLRLGQACFELPVSMDVEALRQLMRVLGIGECGDDQKQ